MDLDQPVERKKKKKEKHFLNTFSQENKNVKQDLDEGEHIQVFVVPMADLIGSINRLSKETNSVVDAKCFALALGMSSKL